MGVNRGGTDMDVYVGIGGYESHAGYVGYAFCTVIGTKCRHVQPQ